MNDYLQLIEDKGIENLDFVIDKITESKYFAGFPIVSQLLGIIKLSKAIPNYLYAKKTCAFLDGIKADNMDCDTFSNAMKELNKNPRKFEEELLFLIEKAENLEKANLLGYFTRMFALRIISYDDFVFYSNVINNIQILFLKQFSVQYRNFAELRKTNIYSVLSSQGLIKNINPQMSIDEEPLLFETALSDSAKEFGKLLSDYFTITKN